MSDLVNRLRGIYNIGVDPKIGPLDGKMVVTRKFDNLPPIHAEAANHIEFLEALVDECVALMDAHKVPISERLRASGRAMKAVHSEDSSR